jgi:transcriptional regulator with XRE-family HTH domain
MDLRSIGQLIAQHRRAKGLTLQALATRAGVGRSTLAALEAGTSTELGLQKVARLCAALDLVLEVRAPTLDQPLMAHRHLTELAGRELTKAAIDDIITRGDMAAWRGLVAALKADETGRLARRVREVAAALREQDPRAQAFFTLVPELTRGSGARKRPRG